MQIRLTTREAMRAIVQKLNVKYVCSDQTLRRVLDKLEAENRLSVQWVRQYRTIAMDDIEIVIQELRETGRIPAGEAAATC